MKKLGLALLLLPVISFADDVSFFGAEYAWLTGTEDGISIDGYMVEYASVNENLSAGLSYVVVESEYYGYGDSFDYFKVDIDFAFGSFEAGSAYAGAGIAFADGDTNEIFKIGFAKRSGEGFDYDLNVGFNDGDTAVEASFRAPLGDSGLGWTFGVAVSDGDVAPQTGLNIRF